MISFCIPACSLCFSATLLHFRNQSSKLGPYVNAKTLLTLTLLQAREAAMSFFRPSLNQHGLTEQQWRVIRILRQQGEMESYQLANQACILRPSMTGVLARLERDGIVRRWKAPGPAAGLREPDGKGPAVLRLHERRHGEELPAHPGAVRRGKLAQLLELLNELKKIKP